MGKSGTIPPQRAPQEREGLFFRPKRAVLMMAWLVVNMERYYKDTSNAKPLRRKVKQSLG